MGNTPIDSKPGLHVEIYDGENELRPECGLYVLGFLDDVRTDGVNSYHVAKVGMVKKTPYYTRLAGYSYPGRRKLHKGLILPCGANTANNGCETEKEFQNNLKRKGYYTENEFVKVFGRLKQILDTPVELLTESDVIYFLGDILFSRYSHMLIDNIRYLPKAMMDVHNLIIQPKTWIMTPQVTILNKELKTRTKYGHATTYTPGGKSPYEVDMGGFFGKNNTTP